MCKTGRGMSTTSPGTLRASPAKLVRRRCAAWTWSPATRSTCKLFGASVSIPPAPRETPLRALPMSMMRIAARASSTHHDHGET